MIYVLARNREDHRDWLHRAGLASRNALYLATPNACRGYRLDCRDVVALPGFWGRRDGEIDLFHRNLVAAGVDWSKIHTVR